MDDELRQILKSIDARLAAVERNSRDGVVDVGDEDEEPEQPPMLREWLTARMKLNEAEAARYALWHCNASEADRICGEHRIDAIRADAVTYAFGAVLARLPAGVDVPLIDPPPDSE